MERPILFSTPMVQAILSGRKTQTRRIIKPQPERQLFPCGTGKKYWASDPHNLRIKYFHHNYGEVGSILWVRETWSPGTLVKYLYKADETSRNFNVVWHPSIFMPKEASRIRLEITNISVKRLNLISDKDCIAEGIEPMGIGYKDYSEEGCSVDSPYYSYKTLWEKINGKGSWEKTPWVWVIEFKRKN